MKKDKNTRLVYSTDATENEKCPRCKELLSECSCPSESASEKASYTVKLRIEKNGRGGKTVTVMDGFPKVEASLKALAADFKARCGAGGTYSMDGRDGVIELQGDQRDQLRLVLTAKGIKFKG